MCDSLDTFEPQSCSPMLDAQSCSLAFESCSQLSQMLDAFETHPQPWVSYPCSSCTTHHELQLLVLKTALQNELIQHLRQIKWSQPLIHYLYDLLADMYVGRDHTISLDMLKNYDWYADCAPPTYQVKAYTRARRAFHVLAFHFYTIQRKEAPIMTIMHHACASGSTDDVQTLLSMGFDLQQHPFYAVPKHAVDLIPLLEGVHVVMF